MTLALSRPGCGDVSGGLVCSFGRLDPLFWEDHGYRHLAGVALGYPTEEPTGGITRARSRPDCGDVSGGLLVWRLKILSLESPMITAI